MDSSPASSSATLDTAWERRTLRTARGLALAAFLALVLVGVVLSPAGVPPWAAALPAGVGAAGFYAIFTARLRRRRRILSRPFPAEWEAVLERDVAFYRALDPAQRRRFRREVQVFIGEKRITGIKVDVDTTTRVLTAASAVIPIFGFPEWEWDQIAEVLIYPGRFDQDFNFGKGGPRHTLGMVGSGAMNRLMILSKPDLLAGFRNSQGTRNVGVHEFTHLVDKADGAIDGVPGLPREAVRPWLELVRRKSDEIRRGDSDIDPYALTNEAEFFAVTSEYFFNRPGDLALRHPELYATLAAFFNQPLGRPPGGGLSRTPCPCGSGRKFGKCCRGVSGS